MKGSQVEYHGAKRNSLTYLFEGLVPSGILVQGSQGPPKLRTVPAFVYTAHTFCRDFHLTR